MNRTRIATAVTLLALGGLTAIALGSRPDEEPQPAAQAAAAQEVRTQVVRRNRTVTQDAPPAAAAPPAPARSAAPPPAAAPPVDTRGDGTPEDGPHRS
jgi:hypothetical protein